MKNRLIPKTQEELSPLGFGAMRLPQKNGRIDFEKAKEQIYYAIDNGVNIIDTAYIYGESEKFLGNILTGEYKDKVKIITKLPEKKKKKREDMDRILDDQLNRLNRESIDYYLIHSVDLKTMNKLLKKGLLEFINDAKSSGKIKHIGFSYHGSKEEFEALVDAYDWEVVMVQYNYFDENIQASGDGIEYAASKGIGIFVMEPLKGGILAGKMPEEAEEIFRNANPNKSNAEWALEWVLNNRNVTTVFSGMNSMEQLDENLKVTNNTEPLSMSFDEMEAVELVKRVMSRLLKINCSTCGYCLPCPQGVNIPECMKIYNEKYLFNQKGLLSPSLFDYYQYVGGTMNEPRNAGRCNGCGKCLRKCPQKLDIPKELKKVEKEFEGHFFGLKIGFITKIGMPLFSLFNKLIGK